RHRRQHAAPADLPATHRPEPVLDRRPRRVAVLGRDAARGGSPRDVRALGSPQGLAFGGDRGHDRPMSPLRSDDWSRDPGVRRLVAVLGQRLAERQLELTGTLTGMIRSIEDLDLDQPLIDLLDASVDSNINTIVHLLINAIPVDRIQAPTAAVEYAVRLAQRGVPSYSLIRAYQMGHGFLMTVVLEEAIDLDVEAPTLMRALQ